MPYRQSAATRKNMKTIRTLNGQEVKQALIDFLYEREIVPEDYPLDQIHIKLDVWASGNDYEAIVTYNEDVLTLT